MKCLGAMFYEEQARIFVQLISSHAPAPILDSWCLIPKKELAHMLIHVSTIFNWKVSFKRHCQCASQLLRKNFEHGWYHVTFRIYVFMFFFTVALNKKLKICNTIKTEYRLYSKPGSSIFLLLRSWSLVLYLLVCVKSKFLR